MEFAGKEYIYLPKQKKEKIKKLRKSEEDNKGDAPPMSIEKENDISSKKEEKKENQIDSDDSGDDYLSVDSNNFNIDLENSQRNMQMNFMPAPGVKFKKAIDTNVCVIRYETLESKPDKVVNELYKCQKCNAYLNKYSTIIQTEEKDKFNLTCEFCFNENKNIQISKENIPENECFEKCVKEQRTGPMNSVNCWQGSKYNGGQAHGKNEENHHA